MAGSVFAQTTDITWDPGKSGTGSDGSGTWNVTTSNTVWATGGSDVAWPNQTSDVAVFGLGASDTSTASSTVTVQGTVNAGGIVLNIPTTSTAIYSISGGSGGTAANGTINGPSGGTFVFVNPATNGNAFGQDLTLNDINFTGATTYDVLSNGAGNGNGGVYIQGNTNFNANAKIVVGAGSTDTGFVRIANSTLSSTGANGFSTPFDSTDTVVVNKGWTVFFTNGSAVATSVYGNSWDLNGFGTTGSNRGAIEMDQSGTFTGSVTLQSDSLIVGTGNNNGTTTFSGQITGSADLFLAGTGGYLANGLIISGSGNNYTGYTVISDTTNGSADDNFQAAIQLGATNALAQTTIALGTRATVAIANVTSTPGYTGDGALDLHGFNQTVAGIVNGFTGRNYTGVSSNYYQFIGNASTSASSLSTLFINGTTTATATSGTTAGQGGGFYGSIVDNFGGNESGRTALEVQNGGDVILLGNNTYTGGTKIDTGGTLQIGNTNAAANGGNNTPVMPGLSAATAITDNGNLIYQLAVPTFVANRISGTGMLTQSGTAGGTLILTGDNSGFSGTVVDGATIQVGNGAWTGNLGTANVTDNGTLVWDTADAQTYSGRISSTGTLNDAGLGILTLTGANTYGGATAVTGGGTLDLHSATGSLGSSSSLTFSGSGGTFVFDNSGAASQTLGALSFGAGAGRVQSNYGGAADTLTFGGYSRTAGATANFVVLGGTPSTNKIVITGQATGLIDQGAFFDGGSPAATYAYYDAGGFVRGINYGVDANSAIDSAGTAFTGTTSTNEEVTHNVTGQGTTSLNTLQLTGGVGSLTQTASTTLTASGILKTGGTAATISGGTLTAAATNELVIRPDSAQDSLTINDTINGSGGLTLAGNGTLILGASNGYTGATSVDSGTLQLGNATAIGANSVVTVGESGALDLHGFAETVSSLSGVGTVESNSGAGTLTVKNGGIFGGSLTDGTGGTLALSATASGSVLDLYGNNTYSGGTTIATGATIVLGADSLGNFYTTGSLGTGAVTLTGTAGITDDVLGTSTLGNNISGGGTFTVGGTSATTYLNNTVVLLGTDSYTGATTVGFGSTLQIGEGGTAGAIGATAITTDANSVLIFDSSNNITYANTISGTGDVVQAGTGTLTLSGTDSFTGGNNYDHGLIIDGGGQVTVTGALSGTSSLQVNFSGVGGTLNWASSGTGTTSQLLGNLDLEQGAATIESTLGSATATTLTFNGRNQRLAGTTVNYVENGGSTGSTNNIVFNSGATTFADWGSFFTSTAGVSSYAYIDGTTKALRNINYGTDSSSYLITKGLSTDTGTGSLTGSVNVNGYAELSSSLSTITYGNAYTIVGIQFAGTNQTLNLSQLVAAGIYDTGGGNDILQNSTGGQGTWNTIGQDEIIIDVAQANASLTVNSKIISGTQVEGFTTSGLGTVILNGANTYALAAQFANTIDQGTLQLGNATALGVATNALTVNGGTLDMHGFNQTVGVLNGAGGTIADNAATTTSTLTVTNNGATGSFDGAITDGSGQVNFALNGGTEIFTGANTYTGTTTIGTGATLQLGANTQAGNYGTAGSLSSSTAITDNGALVFDWTNSPVFSNGVTGTGALTQAGTGTTILTGTNSYQGITSILAGILQIGNGGTSGSLGTGSVTDDAELAYDRTDAQVISNSISGTGNLTQDGVGTAILTGANSYDATIIDAGGTVQVGNGGMIGTLGTGTVSDNGTLALDRTDTPTVANTITGSGSVAVNSGASARVTGANSYTGGTTVNANATLFADNALGSGLGYGNVSVSGTLRGSGSYTPAYAKGITVQASGVFHPGDATSGTVAVGAFTLTAAANDTAPILSFATHSAGQDQMVFDLGSGAAPVVPGLTLAGSSSYVVLGNDVSGEVAFNSTVLNLNDLTGGSLATGNYLLFEGGNNSDYSGLTVVGGQITAGLTIDSTSPFASTATLEISNGDIYLTEASVATPEPSTWALLLGGLGLLGFYQFRVRRFVK